VIYSNFGIVTRINIFPRWQANGWLIDGIGSPSFGHSQWIAQPFAPKVNSHLTIVEVPVQFNNLGDGGTNGFEISINKRCRGLAGNNPGWPKDRKRKHHFPSLLRQR
jgi:hypothetical protein